MKKVVLILVTLAMVLTMVAIPTTAEDNTPQAAIETLPGYSQAEAEANRMSAEQLETKAGTKNWAAKNLATCEISPDPDFYYIDSVEGMKKFAATLNSGITMAGCMIYLAADLDFEGVSDFKGLGSNSRPFKGKFDGQGHTISNLHLSDTMAAGTVKTVGLFGKVDHSGYPKEENAFIKNLVIDETCSFTLEGANNNSVEGAGALIGQSGNAVVKNILNKATVTSENCAGGIIGYGTARIYNCTNMGNITGGGRVGGINGQGNGTVTACVNYGTITDNIGASAEKVNCSAGGIYGVIGNDNITMIQCVNYGTIVSGKYASGMGSSFWFGAEGKTLTFRQCANYGELKGAVNADMYCGNGKKPTINKINCTAAIYMLMVQPNQNPDQEGEIRMLATVDSLYYKKVGFVATLPGEGDADDTVVTVDTTNVYTSVLVDGVATDAVAVSGQDSSKYVVSLIITDIPENAVFTVKAFVELMDGTVIYGEEKQIGELPEEDAGDAGDAA